jgi:hypothetical protein
MNKREKMYSEIEKHGKNLLDLFPATTEKDPVRLSKKLHAFETRAHRLTEILCDSIPQATQTAAEAELERIGLKVRQLLGVAADAPHIFINHDPRGYALKVKDAWLRASDKVLYRDWGGYGILAPDFSEN